MKIFFKKSVSLFLCVLMCFLPSCSNSGESSVSESSVVEKIDYTVEIKTNGGMVLKDIGVFVYADTTQNDLVWAGTTDEKGTVSFTADESEDYIFILRDTPTDFAVDNSYLLNTPSVSVSLEPYIVEINDLDRTYKLGNIMQDYTFKTADGNEYKISELLKSKKAVVLNFWFENCAPCKMEFPYMQSAYEDFKSDIEILALNPLDGTDESVGAFAKKLGLTFPMAAVDEGWQNAMNITSYPTTVVIDRYGMITLIHKGSITDKETFVKMFEYFTNDEYQQKLIKNIEDLL